jgi:hypothetical protein
MEFKHVEKNAHKKEGAAPLQEIPQPKKPVAAQVAKPAEAAKKPPKKEL